MYQNQPDQTQNEKICSIFIQNSSIGVCVFTQSSITINCSQILHICPLDQQLIIELLSNCTELLTNQPRHYLFDKSPIQPKQYKTPPSISMINELLNEIKWQNINKIKNKQHYLNLMCEQSTLKFKALGMILQYLLKESMIMRRCKIFFEDIEYWEDYIFNHVQLTHHEINYLEISQEMFHPSLLIKQTSSNLYEGSSLLKTFDKRIKVKGSKKYLKRIMFNPTYNKTQLQKRHQTILWMQKYLKDHGVYNKIFKGIYTMDCILERFQKGRVEEEDWRKLSKSLENIYELRKCLPYLNLPSIVKKFVDNENWPKIVELIHLIQKTITISPLMVKDEFNQELKYLRSLHIEMPHILNHIARGQNWSIRCKITFISQQGYLIEIPHQIQIPQQYLTSWQEQFSNGNGRFFTNSLTQQLNEEYGDILSRIKDIQVQTLFDLQTEISQHSDLLIEAYWQVCAIQCFNGISIVCMDMAVPKLSSQELIIVNGWNILLGQSAVDNNSFSFSHEKGRKNQVVNSQSNIVNTNYTNRVTIISGPNGAGKTIYMKQLGIIVYMTHCGLFVPAKLAQIPLIDRIITVQHSSSLHNKEIGFSRQLYSLSKIMHKGIITNKCLVLIDQIGLNSDYTIALKTLYACVKYLSKNEGHQQRFKINKHLNNCSSDHFRIPLTLIITHLTMLMAQKIIVENYYTRFLMLDVNNNFDYLFKIKPGLVKSGYGLKAAEGYIKDEKILEKAEQYWKKIKSQ